MQSKKQIINYAPCKPNTNFYNFVEIIQSSISNIYVCNIFDYQSDLIWEAQTNGFSFELNLLQFYIIISHYCLCFGFLYF